jgi:hypothetical protein
MNTTSHRANAWVLQLAAAGLAVLMLGRMSVSIGRESRLRHESGVWTALAMDASHGVVYRPLIGPLGYGGTRYFPVHVLIHAAVIGAGVDPIHAGFGIVVAAAALLMISMFRLMRMLGVGPAIAAAACIVVTGTAAAEQALTTIRGDLLPAALNITALAVCVPLLHRDEKRSAGRAIVAGALFGLTILTKFTTVFGLIAAIIALWLHTDRRHRRTAVVICLTTALVTGVGLLAVQLASHGTFLQTIRASAAGGNLLGYAREYPVKIAEWFIGHDPLGFVLFAFAAAVFLGDARQWRQLPEMLFATTTLATLAMFLSPGVDFNHLIDLQIASVILLAVAIARDAGSQSARYLIGGMTVFAAVAIVSSWCGLLGDLPHRARDYRQLAHDIAPPGTSGPMLTDFALLPVLSGQSPYLLDDFLFPVVAQKYPELQRDLYDKIDRGFFCAVVFKSDPTAPHHLLRWSDGLLPHLNARYVRVDDRQGFQIYRRRIDAALQSQAN